MLFVEGGGGDDGAPIDFERKYYGGNRCTTHQT